MLTDEDRSLERGGWRCRRGRQALSAYRTVPCMTADQLKVRARAVVSVGDRWRAGRARASPRRQTPRGAAAVRVCDCVCVCKRVCAVRQAHDGVCAPRALSHRESPTRRGARAKETRVVTLTHRPRARQPRSDRPLVHSTVSRIASLHAARPAAHSLRERGQSGPISRARADPRHPPSLGLRGACTAASGYSGKVDNPSTHRARRPSRWDGRKQRHPGGEALDGQPFIGRRGFAGLAGERRRCREAAGKG